MFWERFVTIINLPTASALAGKVKPVACSRLSSKRPCSIERQKLRSPEEVTVCAWQEKDVMWLASESFTTVYTVRQCQSMMVLSQRQCEAFTPRLVCMHVSKKCFVFNSLHSPWSCCLFLCDSHSSRSNRSCACCTTSDVSHFNTGVALQARS